MRKLKIHDSLIYAALVGGCWVGTNFFWNLNTLMMILGGIISAVFAIIFLTIVPFRASNPRGILGWLVRCLFSLLVIVVSFAATTITMFVISWLGGPLGWDDPLGLFGLLLFTFFIFPVTLVGWLLAAGILHLMDTAPNDRAP